MEEEIIVIEDATEEEIIVEDENVAIDPTIPDYVRNLTEEEVDKLSILDNTGAGDEYLSNDGTYKKMTDITGTSNYQELKNKPSINDVELDGNKTLEELGIQQKGEYLESETDPTVPGYIKNITQEEIEQWNEGGKDIIVLTSLGTSTNPVVLRPEKMYYPDRKAGDKIYFRSSKEPENVVHSATLEVHGMITITDGMQYTTYQMNVINGLYLCHANINNGISSNVTLTKVMVSNLALKSAIPQKTSQLTNDSNFITNEVADLINYYNKEYIDNLSNNDGIIYLDDYTSNNPYVIDDNLKDGQIFYLSYNSYVQIVGTNNSVGLSSVLGAECYVICTLKNGKKPSEVTFGNGGIYFNTIAFNNNNNYITSGYMMYKSGTSTTGNTVNSFLSTDFIKINNEQTISGKKTFTALPESSISPTTDNQFTNKKYVDDTISTALGNIEIELGGI